jgi:glycosyltransferase involved in cell wall biosynthesis
MRHRLRIWHVVETYPPDYGGGAAITTRDICRLLAERNHEVRVLCSENSDREPYSVRTEFDGQVRVDRMNLPYFKTNDPEGWGLGVLKWRRHERLIDRILRQALRQWRPDIIDYHTTRPLGEQGLLTLGQSGVPLIATLHDAWLICLRVMLLRSPTSVICGGPSALRCLECMYSHYDGSHWRAAFKMPWRLLKLRAYMAYRLWRRAKSRRKIVGAIARSEFMAHVHRPHFRGPVRHIPIGIDLKGLPTERPLRPRKPVRFGFVAGFQPTKGIDHLLNAAASLYRAGLPFQLHVWGSGQGAAREEITRRGLTECVFLRGTFAPEGLWAVYNQMDIAVMATMVAEPFGRVPMEAAAVGVPTLAPAVGGITESIRDGIDGLIYPFRDQSGLEQQMRRIIEDATLLPRLIKNLRPPIDSRDAVAEVECFYASILGLTENRFALSEPDRN